MVIKSETRQKVIADREIGKPIKEIMSEHGVSKASVHKILNERTKELNLPSVTNTKVPDILKPPTKADGDLNEVIEMIGGNEFVPASDGMDDVLKMLGQVKPKKGSKPKKPVQKKVATCSDGSCEKQESSWSNALTVKQSPEEERAGLIQKIGLNVKYYGDSVLKDLIQDVDQFKASLLKKSVNDLKNILALFESTRSIESTSMYIRNTYFMGTKILEGTSGYLKMNLHGLTDRLRAEQDLEMIFKEIAITHASKIAKATSPEMRLLMITLSSVVQIDMMNRIMSVQQNRTQPVPPTKQAEKQEAKLPKSEDMDQKDVEELLKKFSDL